MCGRYHLTSSPADVAELFGIHIQDDFPPRYNIAPSQPIAVIRQNERRQRDYALMAWGFMPSWRREPPSRPMFNVRAETVAEKNSFRSAFKRRRCLIPANGFYFWRDDGDGNAPRCVQRPDGGLFAFAGIWETAVDSDGGEIDTAAILTVAAGPDLRGDAPREAVVIAPEHYAIWMEADERDIDMLDDLLAPAADGFWRCFEISTAVNNARHDGPHLVAPRAQADAT